MYEQKAHTHSSGIRKGGGGGHSSGVRGVGDQSWVTIKKRGRGKFDHAGTMHMRIFFMRIFLIMNDKFSSIYNPKLHFILYFNRFHQNSFE